MFLEVATHKTPHTRKPTTGDNKEPPVPRTCVSTKDKTRTRSPILRCGLFAKTNAQANQILTHDDCGLRVLIRSVGLVVGSTSWIRPGFGVSTFVNQFNCTDTQARSGVAACAWTWRCSPDSSSKAPQGWTREKIVSSSTPDWHVVASRRFCVEHHPTCWRQGTNSVSIWVYGQVKFSLMRRVSLPHAVW